MNKLCVVENLTFGYSSSKMILSDVSFELNKGEIIGILGRNGSGKSTLINLIIGFLKNYTGKIEINGELINNFTLKNRAQKISYIPQSRVIVPDYYSVEDFILEGRRPFRNFGFYTKEDYSILDNVLNECNLENFRDRNINELSGGEFQRCIFAKALIKQSDFFVFDEPLSALDIKYQKEFFKLAEMTKKKLKPGMLISIHDINLAVNFCDRLLVLDSGKIIFDGSSKNISAEILSKAFDTEIYTECRNKIYFYY